MPHASEIHSGREGFSVTFFSYRIKNNPRPKYRFHPVVIESVIGGNSHAEGGIRRKVATVETLAYIEWLRWSAN